MRKNYPISSQELNDKIFGYYSDLVYLLGYEENGSISYSGLYNTLDSSGTNILLSSSGIPSTNMPRMLDFLKFDYIYRKHYGKIKYLEKY